MKFAVLHAVRRIVFLAGGLASFYCSTTSLPQSPSDVVVVVLSNTTSKLNYAATAIAFDRLIDLNANPVTTLQMIDRLVDAARQMAGPNPTDAYKLAAIRRAIYVAGPWNYNRAFADDLTDPLGKNPRNKLLSTYIRTRRGNCVSMPILFVIVADRMGLNVGLATAPNHMFVRYRDPAGVEHNLEPTSGGHEAPDALYRKNFPMIDRAIANGVYMRMLDRDETIAAMKAVLTDNFMQDRRWQEAITIADQMIAANPRDVYALTTRGTASGRLLEQDFTSRYPTPAQIPASSRARYQSLARANAADFAKAEELGWQPEAT